MHYNHELSYISKSLINWKNHFLHILQSYLNISGMKSDAISTIPAEAMQGVTAMAIKSLPTDRIDAFRVDQLSKISYSAAVAFSPSQMNKFSPAQAEAVKAVLQVKPEIFNMAPEEPPVPPPTTDVTSQNDTLDTRGLPEEEDPSIGGRSKDSQTTTTSAPEIRTHGGDTADDPHAPPEPETPSSPSSSSIIQSVWMLNNISTILALIIPVIQYAII